jgi:CMD domain protein
MDLIDRLAGIAPGSPMDALRDGRRVARTHAQLSHDALLAPAVPVGFTIAERLAVAAYVAGLHGAAPSAEHYAAALREHGGAALARAVAAAVAQTAAEGPRGAYPPGPLSAEDTPAPRFALSAEVVAALGPKLVAGLVHAHYLVLHPRDAAATRFVPLHDAGWTADSIVTLSQLVSFLCFQIRVVAGLAVLAATPGDPAP